MTDNFFKLQVIPIKVKDRDWVKDFITKRWGSKKIVYSGKVFLPHNLTGFIAYSGKNKVGLITYQIFKKICQIITLDSLINRKGIATALINKAKEEAKKLGCRKLTAITTNDNLEGLRFYQRRGFSINRVYKNALEKSRKIKPEIPKIGQYGIPLRDEISLELNI